MGCGRTRPKAELLRLVLEGDELRPDPDGRMPGRGTYLCPDSGCTAQALSRQGFQRAFRRPVTVTSETLELVDSWQRSAYTR